MNLGDGVSATADTRAIFVNGTELRGTKHYFAGTHRSVPPAETLEWIKPHLRTAGITRIADVTGLDRIGISTALAFRPNSPTLSNSSGKGFTLTAATVSAAMEAIEVYHAETVRFPRWRASYNEVQERGGAIPRELLRLSRGSLFSVSSPETWIQGWDILTQRPMWVPYLQAALAFDPDGPSRYWRPFETGSNGLASGNLLIEALCAALLEVVERDALACRAMAGRRRSLSRPRVITETIRFPFVRDLLRRLSEAELDLMLYDQTCDTAVPVYMACIYERRDRHEGQYAGFGAHLDPEIAMVRAVTEAVQSRLTYIAGSRDDYFRHDFLANRMSDTTRGVEYVERQAASVDVSELRSESTPTFEGDVAALIEKLRRVGIEHVIALDLTHEELGIPVVRVIVPGLEGCSLVAQYAPGPRALAYVRSAEELEA
jgi:ribosomal protein S12 methylthiotransferase accessory factor